jgi:hypothetical protein
VNAALCSTSVLKLSLCWPDMDEAPMSREWESATLEELNEVGLRLRAERDALLGKLNKARAALHPFADLADAAKALQHEPLSSCEWRIQAKDLYRARATLTDLRPEEER